MDPRSDLRAIDRLRRGRTLLGMVHLRPLPGSPGAPPGPPRAALDALLEVARSDARAIIDGGFDGVIVENFGDTPFHPHDAPPITIASMAAVASALAAELRRSDGEPPLVGINVLRNDARAALAIAAAAGLDFIRVNVHCGAMVTDQGLIEGRAHATLRERAALGAPVAIFADVLVKHATSLACPADAGAIARDTAYRGLADALIVTGEATGSTADPERLRTVRAAVPDRPVLAGSGVTADNVRRYLDSAAGCIVGTALKAGGDVLAAVDPSRVRELARRARERA